MRVTALAPHVGHDAAARIVRRSVAERSGLRDASIAEGVAADDDDRWVDPAAMAGLPRRD
jgi:fumarate hydratase class II